MRLVELLYGDLQEIHDALMGDAPPGERLVELRPILTNLIGKHIAQEKRLDALEKLLTIRLNESP